MQRIDLILPYQSDSILDFEYQESRYHYTNQQSSLDISGCGLTCNLVVRILNFKLSNRRILVKTYDSACKTVDVNLLTGVETTRDCTHTDLTENLDVRLSADETYMIILSAVGVYFRKTDPNSFGDQMYPFADLAANPFTTYQDRLVVNAANDILYVLKEPSTLIQVADWTTGTPLVTTLSMGMMELYYVANGAETFFTFSSGTGTLNIWNAKLKGNLGTLVMTVTNALLKNFQVLTVMQKPGDLTRYFLIEYNGVQVQNSAYNVYFRKFLRVELNLTTSTSDVSSYSTQYRLLDWYVDDELQQVYLLDYTKLEKGIDIAQE